jgi:hypothetical protein
VFAGRHPSSAPESSAAPAAQWSRPTKFALSRNRSHGAKSSPQENPSTKVPALATNRRVSAPRSGLITGVAFLSHRATILTSCQSLDTSSLARRSGLSALQSISHRTTARTRSRRDVLERSTALATPGTDSDRSRSAAAAVIAGTRRSVLTNIDYTMDARASAPTCSSRPRRPCRPLGSAWPGTSHQDQDQR